MSDVATDLQQALAHDFEAAGLNTPPPWHDESPRDVAARLQRGNLVKKFLATDSTTERQNREALRRFMHANTACSMWSLPSRLSLVDATVLELMRAEFASWAGSLDDCTSLTTPVHAGRVSAGLGVGSSCTSAYGKLYVSPVGFRCEAQLAVWKAGLLETLDLTALEALAVNGCVFSHTRLFFVPKNDEVARVAGKEPTGSMFCQLGIETLLRYVQKRMFKIDIEHQAEVNRKLVHRDDVATIDLSSASDTVATKLVEWLLPPKLVEWLRVWRSTHAVVPKEFVKEFAVSTDEKGDGCVPLHMFSTMGNGFTFPLETLIFGSVVRAVYKVLNIPWSLRVFSIEGKEVVAPSTYGVFGDDMIVRRDAYGPIVRILAHLGFKVNSDKSFSEGHFYESCGVDVFKGVNVRPVYVKKLRAPQDFVTVHNLLRKWSLRHDIPLWRTLALLRTRGPCYLQHRVPEWEADDAGYHTEVPCGQAYRAFRVDARPFSIEDGGELGAFLTRGDVKHPVYWDRLLQACLLSGQRHDEITPRSKGEEAYKVVWVKCFDWRFALKGVLRWKLSRAGLLKPALVRVNSHNVEKYVSPRGALVEQLNLFP